MIPKQSFACLLLVSCISAISPGMALSQLDKATEGKLSAMEVKIFTHDYANQSDADRVGRIEKFVFGTTRDDGTLNERIARLANSVKVKSTTEVPYLPRKRAFSDWTPSSALDTTASTQTARTPLSVQIPQAQSRTFSSAQAAHPTYPRVSQVEERLFGENYAAEPINKRLDRLELREFGRLSKSNDLAVRVDTLVSYAIPTAPAYSNPLRTVSYQPTSSIQPSSGYPASTAGNYNTNMFGLFRTEPAHRAQASQSYTVVDQIEFLENATFGKTRPNRTLQKRVHALEEKFYGAPKTDVSQDITSRVAQLLSLVNNGSTHSSHT